MPVRGPRPRIGPIARLTLAVVVVAVLLRGLTLDGSRCCYRAGPLRIGVMLTPSFGPDATSPGDPRDGSEYRYLVRGRWLAYIGTDRR